MQQIDRGFSIDNAFSLVLSKSGVFDVNFSTGKLIHLSFHLHCGIENKKSNLNGPFPRSYVIAYARVILESHIYFATINFRRLLNHPKVTAAL